MSEGYVELCAPHHRQEGAGGRGNWRSTAAEHRIPHRSAHRGPGGAGNRAKIKKREGRRRAVRAPILADGRIRALDPDHLRLWIASSSSPASTTPGDGLSAAQPSVTGKPGGRQPAPCPAIRLPGGPEPPDQTQSWDTFRPALAISGGSWSGHQPSREESFDGVSYPSRSSPNSPPPTPPPPTTFLPAPPPPEMEKRIRVLAEGKREEGGRAAGESERESDNRTDLFLN